jgi:hypothetical protein
LIAFQNTYDADGVLTEMTSSNCISSFTTFETKITDIRDAMNEDDYTTAREAKGTGSGTHIGYLISNFAQYQQLTVTFYDFYNNCNLDYYMVALGSNT